MNQDYEQDYKNQDYKNAPVRLATRSAAGPMLIGVFIGILLGFAIAFGVAWYVYKMPSPFLSERAKPANVAQPAVKSGEANVETPAAGDNARTARAPVSEDAKPRFEFYKILPGDEVVSDQQFKQATAQPPAARARSAYFLQAGAFQNAAEADRMKAELALLGVEARVQTTTLPDKGIWHRVRLGPFSTSEELNRARETLKQNGIEASLIKVSG